MFIVVPFISSTELASVAEADMRSGDFFFLKKSCRYKMVVSTSFWSWLLNVSSVLTTKKIHCDIFFGLLKRFGHYILILVLMILKYVFFVFVLDAIFCGTSFFFHFSGHFVAS